MSAISNNLDEIKAFYDFDELKSIAYTLANLERRSSYGDFERSTRYCVDVMKALGFSDVRRMAHKANGVNCTFDCVMPQAWSHDEKKHSHLEIVQGDLPDYLCLLADSDENPLEASFWSAPTPKGGITAELVNFDDLGWNNLAAARGKWLLYAPPEGCISLSRGLYGRLVASGAVGLVLSNMGTMDTMPNGIQWFNGIGNNGWYLTKGEPRLPAFSITAVKARLLKELLKKTKVTLHGELNSRIYDGEIYTVTGIVTGESTEEIALFAHLYEPFVGDDAVGFAHLCEFGAQLIRRKVKLQKTLRLVFSMELYGFAEYLKKHGKNIVMAANFDGVAFHESSKVLLRRTPFLQASFSDWTNDDILRQNLPTATIEAECGNLSDDTFANDSYFNGGIPTFWFHSPCEHSHHCTGFEFTPDWKATAEQLPVFAAALEYLLCVEKLPDFSARAVADIDCAAKSILADDRLTNYDKKIYLQVEHARAEKRLLSVVRHTGQKVNMKPLLAKWNAIQKEIAKLPPQEFSPAEYRALNMIVTPGKYGMPFSLAQVPLEERRNCVFSRLLWSLFDGRRNLLECIRMENAELGVKTTDGDILKTIDNLKYVSKYGYATLTPAFKLTKRQFKDALRELGVVNGMKLMVHCSFSSLGEVQCGPEGICDALEEAIGENGMLMMPGFPSSFYRIGKRTVPFDVKNTPAETGVLSETFRKRNDVLRSFDPCHPYSVWGKDARKYVERHHLVPTIDPLESPLALLRRDDGWCMTISCCSHVTFMHVVEAECGAKCCDIRSEEYDAILPDSKRVKLRTWSWRKNTCNDCPSNRTDEIFAEMRQRGKMREIMLNNAHIALFPLEEYFAVYAALMRCFCNNEASPRKNELTVPSDWNAKKRRLKKTTAYTGPWMK